MATYVNRHQASSTVVDENKRGLQKGTVIGAKAAFGTSTSRSAVAGTHRRALSELGNIVSTAEHRTDKENAVKVQPSQIVTRGAARRTSAAPKAAQQKPLQAELKPRVAPAKASSGEGEGESGVTNQSSLASRPSRALAPTPAAPTELPRSSSTDSALSTVEHEAALLLLPSSLSAVTERNHNEAENDNDSKRMSMTASLTACSEEACGMELMHADESIPDIDAEDVNNPLAVTQYVEDIYSFYRRSEKMSMVVKDYMVRQTDINEKMRGILVDWLVEVHYKFKLLPETLYLTTNLIDRYLAVTPMTRKNLQLVGVTAMLVASKYEEIWAPEVKDFVYISDNAYSKDQILNMEKHMLNTLSFNLTLPTPYVFAARFLKAAATAADKAVQNLTWYLLELCLPDYQMISFSPSLLAAAAVYTALHTVTPSFPSSSSSASSSSSSSSSKWTPSLRKYSGYSEKQLYPCVELMVVLQQKSAEGSLTAVHKKYSSTKFLEVAQLSHAELPICS